MPEITLTLPGSIRIKKNSRRLFSLGKGKRVVNLPSKAYLEWEEQSREVAIYVSDWQNLRCPVEVCALCYVKGQLPDLSGALESVGDCLEGVIWENDKQIKSWDGSRVIPEKKNPRTEVTVRWAD